MVIDRDYQSWDERQLSYVAQQCHQKKGFNLGLSNPAFELWLLLHLRDLSEYTKAEKEKLFRNPKVSTHKTVLKQELGKKTKSGYNESNYNPLHYIINVKAAIERARQLDINPRERWPNHLGTRVYKLAERIAKGR